MTPSALVRQLHFGLLPSILLPSPVPPEAPFSPFAKGRLPFQTWLPAVCLAESQEDAEEGNETQSRLAQKQNVATACCSSVTQSCQTLCDPRDCSLPGFSRQEYWSGLLWPSPEDLSSPGIRPGPPALASGFFTV